MEEERDFTGYPGDTGNTGDTGNIEGTGDVGGIQQSPTYESIDSVMDALYLEVLP